MATIFSRKLFSRISFRGFKQFLEVEPQLNDILFTLLGEFCDKPAKQVMKDASRDLWLSSDEALNYGIIDEIIKTKK